MNQIISKLKKIDFVLIIAVVLLTGLGFLAIFGATFNKLNNQLSFLNRQVIAFAIGVIVFFLFSLINYRNLRKFSFLIFVASAALLILVLVIGKKVNGATSWIDFGFMNFQPVEFIKLAMIIILANFFAKHFRKLNQFKYIALSFLVVAIPICLILFQPDPGSAFVIFCIWAGLVLAAGIRKMHIIILILLAITGSLFGWRFVLKDYQKARVTSFANPYQDPKGRGYNAIQSVIAVGSGGVFGKGIGNGSQGRLNFLPERHTDFIFANIAEELGFVGVSFLLILYGILLTQIFKIALKANDNFARFLAIGIALMIFTHVLENVGMNIGIMPITGIPLPLISFGGSNLVVTLAALGIMQSILIHKVNPLKDEQLDFF